MQRSCITGSNSSFSLFLSIRVFHHVILSTLRLAMWCHLASGTLTLNTSRSLKCAVKTALLFLVFYHHYEKDVPGKSTDPGRKMTDTEMSYLHMRLAKGS